MTVLGALAIRSPVENGTGSPADAGTDDAERGHRTASGTVVADAAFLRRLGRAAWLTRLVYNAVIDPHVPFAVGVAPTASRGPGRSAAARRSRPSPRVPRGSSRSTTRPTSRRQLTALIRLHPELREFTRSILDNAVAQACAARAEHLRRCAIAKAAGTKQPVLHFRRAVDGWSVTTDTFQILRLGDGPAQPPAKTRSIGTSAARNRRRRENHEIFREAAWAEERRRCGWSEDRVAFHLERRAGRQARDRARQDELQATHVAAGKVAHAARIEARRAERAAAAAEDRAVRRLPPDKVRRDSPGATVGHRRMKVDVLGLGRRRVDLGFEIPEGADVVRVTYLKPGWRGAKVEARLGMTVPPVEPKHDEMAVRLRLHAFAREMPVSATPLQAALAARAAGIACVGIDFGSAHPHCDDRGREDPPGAHRPGGLAPHEGGAGVAVAQGRVPKARRDQARPRRCEAARNQGGIGGRNGRGADEGRPPFEARDAAARGDPRRAGAGGEPVQDARLPGRTRGDARRAAARRHRPAPHDQAPARQGRPRRTQGEGGRRGICGGGGGARHCGLRRRGAAAR